MAGLTLEIANARLTAYLAAEEAVLLGQAVEIDTGSGRRKLTRADLSYIQKGIELWQGRVVSLERNAGRGGIAVREVIPR